MIKKGDYVIGDGDDNGFFVGRAMDDENSDGEIDVEFMDGGTMSPAGDCVVVSETLARFVWGAIDCIPESGDPESNPDGLRYIPDDILKKIILSGRDGYTK